MKPRLSRTFATAAACLLAAMLLLPTAATADPSRAEGRGQALPEWMGGMMFGGRDYAQHGYEPGMMFHGRYHGQYGYGPGMMRGGYHRSGGGSDNGFDGPSTAAMVAMMAVLIAALPVLALWLSRHRGGSQPAAPPST